MGRLVGWRAVTNEACSPGYANGTNSVNVIKGPVDGAYKQLYPANVASLIVLYP